MGEENPLSAPVPSLLAWFAIKLAKGYKRFISPFLGRHCRFHPTCSVYYMLAVQKHGFFVGSFRGFLRICRCHPFHPGGVDYP